jgi:hypothetical protein
LQIYPNSSRTELLQVLHAHGFAQHCFIEVLAWLIDVLAPLRCALLMQQPACVRLAGRHPCARRRWQARMEWQPNESEESRSRYQQVLLSSDFTLAPAGLNTE